MYTYEVTILKFHFLCYLETCYGVVGREIKTEGAVPTLLI